MRSMLASPRSLCGCCAQTLFVKCLPRSTVSRVWDCFFVHGTPFLFRVTMALIELLSPSILHASFEDCIQTLTASATFKATWREVSDGRARVCMCRRLCASLACLLARPVELSLCFFSR